MKATTRAAVILLATLIGASITASLGVWQLHRAAQKTALHEQQTTRAQLPVLSAADLPLGQAQLKETASRKVKLQGRFLTAHNVFLDNRQMQGRVGFYLLTPLQLASRAEVVLVQRGWVPRNFVDRTQLPSIATPSGVVEVEGLIAPPPAKLYEFSSSERSLIRQNIDLDAFARETGLQLVPASVLETRIATGTEDPGLQQHWSLPTTDVQKHKGYALQWFAMSALMLGLYFWFQVIRPLWAVRHSSRHAAHPD